MEIGGLLQSNIIRYSIFLDQTDFGVQKQNEKSPWVFFFSPCPPPFFFFKGSCWAIDFLWLAHLVLIIAHFLPGISRKQLSDKFLFRWCYLATASCPITNSLLVQQLNSLKLFHCCRKIHKTSTSQTVFSMKNKTSLLGCLAFQLEAFGSTRFI